MQFKKENFKWDGMYLTYCPEAGPIPGVEQLGEAYIYDKALGASVLRPQYFIARFKHVKRERPGFVKFLMANFTVEEYLHGIAQNSTPMGLLQSKGYVCYTAQQEDKRRARAFEYRGLA